MDNDETDAAAIRASLKEPTVFGAIFDRHWPRIHRYCVERAGPAAGQDIAAETVPRRVSPTRALRTRAAGATGLHAIVVWLMAVPAALLLPAAVNLSPFTPRGSALPLVAGAAMLAGVLLAVRAGHGERLPGVAIGLFAGWVVFGMRTGLHGTPWGYMDNDTLRLSAMAERYTRTLHSADGIVASVPSEYPPLFPLVVGRLALVLHTPAWRLLGLGEELFTSATVVSAFLLWRRMLPGWLAVAVTVALFAAFPQPAKPYEVMALNITIPWLLAAFADTPGQRLRAAPAGVICGLLISLYWGYLLFTVFGSMAIVWRAARHAPSATLRRVAAVASIAVLVSAWYLVPYLHWAADHGLQMTDRYQDPLISANPFPFLAPTPIGALTAIGVVGLVWYRASVWWAEPLLCLTLGTYAFRFLAETQFIATGYTQVFQYTVHVVIATLAAAGVLTIARAAPSLANRLSLPAPAGLATLAVAATFLWVGTSSWQAWMPGLTLPGDAPIDSVTTSGYRADLGFQMPLPNGTYPRYAPSGRVTWFPTVPIVNDVHRVLDRSAAPTTLSWSETLFATQPWPGYIGVSANAAAGTEHWFSRVLELGRLARTHQPAAFAYASAHTPFGPINAFVLYREGRAWVWSAINGHATIHFSPSQFTSAFTTFPDLPDDTVLAVRRPTFG